MDTLNDLTIIHEFVKGKTQFLSNLNLCIEGDFTKSQLFSTSKKLLAIIRVVNKTRSALVRQKSEYCELLEQVLQKSSFIPIGTEKEGLIAYEQHEIPLGYTLQYTQAVNVWEAWYPRQTQQIHDSRLDILMFFQKKWHPIKEMSFEQDRLILKTLYSQINLDSEQQVAWVCKSHKLIVNKSSNLINGYYQKSLPVENCTVYPRYSENRSQKNLLIQKNNYFTQVPAKAAVNPPKLASVRAQHLEKHTPATVENLALAQNNFATEITLSSQESFYNQSSRENKLITQLFGNNNMDSHLDNSNECQVYSFNPVKKSTEIEDKNYVLKFADGRLYIQTEIGEIVIEGSDYQFKINPNNPN
ncbi:hypothetical protein Cri9333_1999 [Crinalium epipsammum PCC 9333]|uniref:Uncharacterized protein n=1 Tax=Crinalium epipsammum PCC 9333 TaxID=1173022 RepID=K9VXN9_9CYAN|nr:hypothetical protein [Crinalium epipsammum]AFZ12878.1 hypothetical protein Cri9333_1999 [Crinalium epipsammum PCC 9333]